MRTAWLLLVVSAIVAGCGGSADRRGGTKAVTLEDLELSVPATWSVTHLPVECGRYGPGILVANTGRRFERYVERLPLGACTTAWDLREVPDTVVAVDLSRIQPPPPPGQPRFPPRLQSDRYVSPITREPLCRCVVRFASFSYRGCAYTLRVWVGNGAAEVDRASAAAVIASLRPAPAQDGAGDGCEPPLS
jgi:hypothetical protein